MIPSLSHSSHTSLQTVHTRNPTTHPKTNTQTPVTMQKNLLIVLISLACCHTSLSAQTKTVKGQIAEYHISTETTYTITGVCTDHANRPLKNVRVMIKSGVGIATSDENGRYNITVGRNDKALVFFFPGMRVDEAPINFQTLTLNKQLSEDITDYTPPRHTKTATPWFDPQNDNPDTYCNPLNIAYNFKYHRHTGFNGPTHRSTADPIIVPYKGDYYLFSTNQSGYYVSKNLASWQYIFAGFQRKPTDDDQCAPTVEVFGDTLIMLGSTYNHLPVWYTTNPLAGRWKQLTPSAVLPHWDPSLFLDDDGRLYLYYGSSNEFPLKGVEYDRKTFRPKSLIHDLVSLHPEKHGWERFGMNNDDSTTLKPFTEGAFVTKHNGKYYLQYGAPGTEFKVYADGVYVADHPLGPFTYQTHNPMSYKPGGFVLGAGHGGTFKDNHTNYWHVATCMLSLRETFERRIGMYPTAFDDDGIMYANTAFGDYPTRIPQHKTNNLNDLFTGWMLLSLHKKVRASSSDSIHTPENAADENMRTYWAAQSANPGEWFAIDLGEQKEVNALQVNFYEHKANQFGRAFDIYHQYRIFHSTDGNMWQLLVDKSDNDTDVPHDYIQLRKPINTRFLKIENVHTASGHFALMDFRVFGNAKATPPRPVKKFNVNRSKTDPRNATISWEPQTGCYGYNIYYGIAPDKMYHCITVYDAHSYHTRGLDKNTPYYFAIRALNETGISEISKPLLVK